MPYGGSAPSLPIIGASGGSPLSDKGHGAAGPGATPLVPGLTNAADAGAGTGVVQVGDNNRADFSARGTLGQGAMPGPQLSESNPTLTMQGPSFASGSAQDVTLAPQMQHGTDVPLFRAPNPLNQPASNTGRMEQGMPGLEPAPANHMTDVPPSRAQDSGLDSADSASLFKGTPLGGAGWLGLGGSAQRQAATGDSGGGGEFNVLSEFLESLDDPMPWSEPKEVAQSGSEPMLPLGLSPGATSAADSAQESNETDSSFASFLPPGLHGSPGKRRRTEPGGEVQRQNGSIALPGRLDRMQAAPSSSFAQQAAQQGASSGAERSSGAPSDPSSLGGTKTERFLLTAADQTDGSRDERLRKVIQAKYEAGLLRPYNHVNGYARLNRWMERNVSATSRRRILKQLSVFRPMFFNVAKSLTNFDLIYIEEAFERLLLDYDRVFSMQGIPACLWRRTGEIYKGNKEFAELAGVSIESLRDGRLCIYELMAEESAVNYWEKYGSVSFDPSQKAVLTMCKLRTKNRSLVHATASAQERRRQGEEPAPEAALEQTPEQTPERAAEQASEAPSKPRAQARDEPSTKKEPTYIPCCFSFTIRRDKWNVRVALRLAVY